MREFINIDQISTTWNISPSVLEEWCINKKVEAIYTNDSWLINTNQYCPLQTFEEYIVYLLPNVANEFNNLGASIIYYNGVYVYTDLTPEIHTAGDTVILTKDIITRISTTELAHLCYIQYLFDYQKETGCYPIFLKYSTLKM